MKKQFLFYILSITTSINAQINFSADEDKNLLLNHEVKVDSSNITEIANCISENDFLQSITSFKNNKDNIYINGTYEYTYYVNNSEKYAGIVSHNYLISIENNLITFKYFNFIHSKDDSIFNSIGKLPSEFNYKTKEVFTQENYEEILKDLKFNIVNHIRVLRKNCF